MWGIQETWSATGAKLKGAICAQCGQEFAYIQVCSVSGSDQTRVAKGVRWSLNSGDAPVPCPRCQFVDRLAARRATLRALLEFPWYNTVAIALILSGAVILFLLENIAGLAAAIPGAVLLIHKYGVIRLDYGKPKRPRSQGKPSAPPVWTREELERLAKESPSTDISDAILDWESQRIRTPAGGRT
jgi:hypothetical protein